MVNNEHTPNGMGCRVDVQQNPVHVQIVPEGEL